MKAKHPITFEALVAHLHSAGVPASVLIKHRLLMEILGAKAYTLPRAAFDGRSIRLTFRRDQLSIEISLNLLSTVAHATKAVHYEDGYLKTSPRTNLRVSDVSDLMLWLYPIEFSVWDRTKIWIQQKWIDLKAWCGRIVPGRSDWPDER